MLLRLALVLGLVGSLSTSQAQPFELTRPGDDELAALAQLTVDDSPPAFGGTFDLAAV